MTAASVTVERIDHIEVFVPDRYDAATWYRRVLGLEIMRGPAWEWAVNLPNGPLFLASPSGTVKVSLFEGEPLRDHPPIGQAQTCFTVNAESFLRFRDQLDDLGLRNRFGERVTADQISDHKLAWAFYFTDPYGNRYELNTYDYEPVWAALKRASEVQAP
ncbi:MAG TPA: VOC family protein [Chloroflexota bacterium]|nr:VOC family protein [Chloroflexota bacterium]